jgi:glycosyltransferase involved in cell wall biosynthesis
VRELSKVAVWLTWEHQTRNKSMAALLSVEYGEFISNRSRLFRYIELSFKTLNYLVSKRPQVIFFQNPSIVLACLCVCYSKLWGNCMLVGDFHNIALVKTKIHKLNCFVSRNIDFTLVSNENLLKDVVAMGGRGYVMPDPIPEHEFESSNAIEQHKQYILFISSWASDEPINEVIAGYINSSSFDDGIRLLVTGRKKIEKLDFDESYYSSRGIEFLGFVDEARYWSLLQNSLLNIDLTTRDDCLVCGAYESLAVGAPILLSNNNASVSYFDKAALFTDNTSDDIAIKIKDAVKNTTVYRSQTTQALAHYKELDHRRKSDLLSRLSI